MTWRKPRGWRKIVSWSYQQSENYGGDWKNRWKNEKREKDLNQQHCTSQFIFPSVEMRYLRENDTLHISEQERGFSVINRFEEICGWSQKKSWSSWFPVTEVHSKALEDRPRLEKGVVFPDELLFMQQSSCWNDFFWCFILRQMPLPDFNCEDISREWWMSREETESLEDIADLPLLIMEESIFRKERKLGINKWLL